MIVLRITARNRHREHRFEQPEVVLGTDPAADVVEADVGWAGREAVLVHRGTEVELRPTDGRGHLKLRVGDTIRLGDAEIALVGLLPLPEPATPPEEEEAAADKPVFGGYEEGWPPPQPFSLVDSLPRADTPPPKPGPKPGPTLPRPDTPKPKSKPTPPRADTPNPPPSPPPEPPPSRRDGKPQAPGTGTPPRPRPPVPSFGQIDFGEELVRQLHRAPFFVISVALHLLAVFILSLLQVPPDAHAEEVAHGTLLATVQDDADLERFDDDVLLPDTPLSDLPDVPLPTLPEDEPDPEPPPEGGEELAPLEDDAPLPFTVGMNPTLSSTRSSTGRKQSRLSPSEMTKSFAGGEARTANERAADYVRAELGRGTGREGDPLGKLIRSDILVVRGTFDHIGKVLDALKLPYLLVPARSMALSKAPDLSRHKVVFWNCGESLPRDQQLVATRRLRSFVKKGGFLFTTDWSVSNVLKDAFEGYVGTNGPRRPLPETVVDIRPAPGQAGHELLEGVFRPGVQGRWWLEQASFDVLPLRHDVKVLIESPDLAKIYKRSPAVAVTFKYGRGRVLHVMGHYFQEAGNLAGTVSAQRLALNFVLMRLAKIRRR